MVTIQIGPNIQTIDTITESWIHEQLGRPREHGAGVCVRLTVDAAPLNMILTTPGCGGGFGGRAPNREEQEVLELWARLGLATGSFSGGNLIAFLHQLTKFVRKSK